LDEPTSRKIVIKFNGKNQEISHADQKESLDSDLKVSSWEEKVKMEKEVAATSEKKSEEDEDFPWVLPEDPKVVIPRKDEKMKKIKKLTTSYSFSASSPSLKKNILTIILAIIVGIGFGTFALHLLSKDTAKSNHIVLEESENEKTIENNQAVNIEESSLTIPIYIIQVGKYSNRSGAEAVASEIKKKGYPSVIIEADGAFFVFSGLAHTKEQIKALKHIFLQENIETYDKEISIKLSAKNADETKRMIEKLIAYSASMMTGTQSFPQQDREKLNETAKQMENLDSSLVSAAEMISTNSPTREQLWEVQQLLLQFFIENGKIQ
jgi:stage II sporulation protein B